MYGNNIIQELSVKYMFKDTLESNIHLVLCKDALEQCILKSTMGKLWCAKTVKKTT